MTISYSLIPTAMTVAARQGGETNVVIRVDWQYVATDGIYKAINPAGFTNLTYVSGAEFTPYDQLTQAEVAEWVLGSWSPEQLAANQKPLADSIAAQKAAPYSSPKLPWIT